MANIFQNLPTQSGNNPLQMLSEFKRFASMTNPQNAKAEPSGSISTQGQTVFERAIAGKDFSGVLPILCDLMITLEAVNPVLYRKVIEKLSEV